MGFVFLTLAVGLFIVGARSNGVDRCFFWGFAALNLAALAKGLMESDPMLWRFKNGEIRPSWDNYRR